MTMSVKRKKICLFSVGSVLVVVGGVMGYMFPTLFQILLRSELALTNSSRSYGLWKETPIPLFIEFHMFNWTNPEETLNKGEKPNFIEMGPYVFREHHERMKLHWHPNDTITFQTNRTWHFMPEMSKGSLSDKVTNLNVIALTAAHMVRGRSTVIQWLLSAALTELEHRVYFTKCVGDLLFDGVDDPLLSIAGKLNASSINIPFTKFAWFFGRNGSITYDGVFNMYTGKDDISKLGILDTWDWAKETPFYGPPCGMVNGTMGELWPPHQEKNNITMYSSDICRSVTLHYTEEKMLHGVTGYKYVANRELFDNGTYDASTECFCDGECVPVGMLNVSSCRFGAPAFMSYPHFYLADKYYHTLVNGMKPEKDKHEFYMVLEPTSGVPVDVAARAQLNLLLQPYEHIGLYEKVPTAFFPMVWFNQKAYLSGSLATQIKLLLLVPAVGTGTCFVVLGIGLLLLVIGVMLFIRKGWDRSDKRHLISEQDEAS